MSKTNFSKYNIFYVHQIDIQEYLLCNDFEYFNSLINLNFIYFDTI